MTLGGLLKHLSLVEDQYIVEFLTGDPLGAPGDWIWNSPGFDPSDPAGWAWRSAAANTP